MEPPTCGRQRLQVSVSAVQGGYLSRIGSFRVKLVVWFGLLALLPLAIAFYGYARLATPSETPRADAALQGELRTALTAYAARLDAAAARAEELAARPAMQHALRSRD